MLLIGIAEDNYTATNGLRDAASPVWEEVLVGLGHLVRKVNVTSLSDVTSIIECDGFMWRWAHFGGMARIARRLIPALENYWRIPCFPNQTTCWHYDDKIAQAYVFNALKVPHIETSVFFDRNRAKAFLATTAFPIVLKLSTGASSSNVMLVGSKEEGMMAVDRLFEQRFTRLFPGFPTCTNPRDENTDRGQEAQSGYVLFQKFLPNNEKDIRITVVGNTAYVFVRRNRDNDFRASGSGLIDYDPELVPLEAVRLAFDASSKLGMQSVAFDILRDDEAFVVNEVSYTYVTGALDACPGQWIKNADGAITWRTGHRRVELDQVDVFLAGLSKRS